MMTKMFFTAMKALLVVGMIFMAVVFTVRGIEALQYSNQIMGVLMTIIGTLSFISGITETFIEM